MPANPEITPEVRSQVENVIATALDTFMQEFITGLFPDASTAEAQDCVVGGIAQAVSRYEASTGRPIARAVTLALIDLNKD